MTASSVTGKGHGSAGKITATGLETLANAPDIIFTGIVDGDGSMPTSPPAYGNTVYFPYALQGDLDNYVILLTTLNGGSSYVAQRHTNSQDKFSGFSFITEAEGKVMYLVAKVGTRANI